MAGGHAVPNWDEVVYSTSADTVPLKDRSGNFVQNPKDNPFDLKDPKVVEQKIEYDPESGEYKVTEKLVTNITVLPAISVLQNS